MPTLDTAIVYPGMVLFEGTNLSEGRGTTRPFEIVGAPWIDGDALADAVNGEALLGAFRRLGPERFAWREPPYEYETVKMPIDILYGSDELRKHLDAGVPAREIASEWDAEVRRFEDSRRRYLLY